MSFKMHHKGFRLGTLADLASLIFNSERTAKQPRSENCQPSTKVAAGYNP